MHFSDGMLVIVCAHEHPSALFCDYTEIMVESQRNHDELM
jgi:hypothetical protein